MERIAGLTRAALDKARRSRDARFDGRFFIAVRTTRIYCRPICPSRLSNDANVCYYATAEEAAEAGYRPCLRCRPEAAPGSCAWGGTSAVVRRALRLIQEGALDEGSVGTLAGQLGIGVRHLSRLFALHVGAAPATIARTRRLHLAKQLVDDTTLSITDIALAAGFRSIRRFNDAFRATYRRSPRELRKVRPAARTPQSATGITLRLAYHPPYDWVQMSAFLSARAIPGLEELIDGHYTRAVATAAGHAILAIGPSAIGHALQVRIEGASPAELPPLLSSVRRMFDLMADPTRIAAALRGDPLLRPLLARHPGLRIPGAWDPFECVVRALLEERGAPTTRPAALKALVAQFGTAIVPAHDALQFLFPSPAALADADLTGIVRQRTPRVALRAIARAVCDGTLRFDTTVAQMRRTLMTLPDVPQWLCGYVELRALGDPDAFPIADRLPRRLGAAERWRPFRGYATVHLWLSEHQRRIPQLRLAS